MFFDPDAQENVITDIKNKRHHVFFKDESLALAFI